MFYVGQKCTLKRKPREIVLKAHPDKAFPEYDVVYTVRCVRDVKGLTLLLAEIINPVVDCGKYGMLEQGFGAEHFRPVVDKKTDISIFQEMCNKPSTPALDPAQPEGVV